MLPLPNYIKNLKWGDRLFFLHNLNLCVHTKNSSFTVTWLSSGESKKFNIKNTYKFIECANTNRIFFSSYVHYSKNKIYFYVLDLNKQSPERIVAKLNSENMSVFLSEDETTATVIPANGNIVSVDIDGLLVKEVMSLSAHVTELTTSYLLSCGSFYFPNPWYRIQKDVYEVVMQTRDNRCSFARLNVANKLLELNCIQENSYSTSVYLDDMGIWVHKVADDPLPLEESISNLHPVRFEIRRGGEVFWKFEILCKLVHESIMFSRENNIKSLTKDTFVICLSSQICLCDVKKLKARVISFKTRFSDVFFDTARGHIIPVYYGGSTRDVFTLDDFKR